MSTSELPAKVTLDSAGVWSSIVSLAADEKLQPGDALPSVRELAARLRLKPTTIRDALIHAQGQGAVRIVPRVGAFLQGEASGDENLSRLGIDPAKLLSLSTLLEQREQNVLHLLDARRLIEIELIGRAARRRHLEDLLPARKALEALLLLPIDATRAQHVELDLRFHAALAQLAGNSVLAAIQQLLLNALAPYLNSVHATHDRRTIVDRMHSTIYAAVVAGDEDGARQAMREHLSLAYDALIYDVQRLPQGVNVEPLRGAS